MIIYPAIDIYGGRVVRLYKGDYARMTVYSDDPVSVTLEFVRQGADHIHIVDLEGARSGGTPNFENIIKIKRESGAFCEVGGGVRTYGVIEKYLDAGIDRVVLGTAAMSDPALVGRAAEKYGGRIAVGVDLRDGRVAVKGWTETTDVTADDFCRRMVSVGIKTFIVTDISKDGAMSGTNLPLYRRLTEEFPVNIIASGGVSSIDDIKRLAEMKIHGAIIGKAYYTGAVELGRAVCEARRYDN